MVKPDGVQRALIGDIVKRFEQKGFKLVAIKFVQVFDMSMKVQVELSKLSTVGLSHYIAA
jgi:nucleoside diphosphate kinase